MRTRNYLTKEDMNTTIEDTESTYQDLWDAVSSIALMCDGAESEDGVGFNGRDTKFGRRLAGTSPDQWTAAMASDCHTMLATYQGQLENYGFVYTELPVPTKTFEDGRDDARQAEYARRDQRTIDYDLGEFHVYFTYNAGLVSEIRNIMGSSWDSDQVRWVIDGAAAGQLRAFGEAHAFTATEAANAVLREHEAVAVDTPVATRRLTLVGRDLIFEFDYDAELVDAVKAITGRRWDTKRKVWVVPMTSSEQAVGLATMRGFEMDDATTAALSDVVSDAVQRGIDSEATDATLHIENLGGTLRPFQRAGVAYAIKAQRTFVADEMGLGKTVQALAAIQAKNSFPALVVCPASLKHNWEREARKWLPGKNVHIVDSKVGVKNADIVIINYDILTKQAEALGTIGFQSLIFDESHYVKNPAAKRTKALKGLAKSIPDAGMVLALTGTPVLNRPVELVSQLEILGRIDDFGGSWNFRKRYCNATRNNFGWDFSGSANTQELNDLLRRTCYVRRNKADVLKELPPKTRSEVNVDLKGDAIRQYRAAEANTLAYFSENGAGGDTANHLSQITTLKRLAGEGKVEAACEWIDTFLDSTDRKLVVFAHHVSVVDAIAAQYGGLRVAGKDTAETRQAAVDSFQTDPSKRVIVLNMKAGGVGLTLTAASDVLFVEQGWTPGEHDQAEDRCHRIGQEDNVAAWYLLANGTIDDDIFALIEKKRIVVDAVTDGAEAKNESVLTDLVKRLVERTQ